MFLFSLISTLVRVFFSCMDVEFYQKLFLHLSRWSCGFCLWLVWCITCWFAYIEPSLWPWVVTLGWIAQLWYMIFFMCCWIQFANILLRIFPSIFIKDIGLYFSFLVASLVLVSGWWWLPRMSFGAAPPLQSFRITLGGSACYFLCVW